MSRFRPHGEYHLDRDGSIIRNFASGSVNRETIENYTREIAEMIRSFDGKPFAIYSEYDPQVLLTHDAAATLSRSIRERAKAGMCAAVLNLSKSDHRTIVGGQIGGLYDEAGVPWRLFDDYEAAKIWLEGEIAAAERRSGLS